MQHQQKWQNWPVLLAGIFLVIFLVFLSKWLLLDKAISTYVADVAGAVSAVIISIATYDEWERRQERKRYRPPEALGIRRIKSEMSQLLYLFAFMLVDRYDPKSQAMKTLKTAQSRVSLASRKPKITIARQLADTQADSSIDLITYCRKVLGRPKLTRLSRQEAYQLIHQIADTVSQLDVVTATYGYSFTPEVHKAVLQLREALDNIITGRPELLKLKVALDSARSHSRLDAEEQAAMKEAIVRLLQISHSINKLKAV